MKFFATLLIAAVFASAVMCAEEEAPAKPGKGIKEALLEKAKALQAKINEAIKAGKGKAEEVAKQLGQKKEAAIAKLNELKAQLEAKASCRCLEGLRLEIFPNVAHRGGEVRMTCIYDLGDSPLCYIKWYRGNFEFYRYTPSENPPHKLFPYPGIHVNVGLSNGTQVVLDGLGLGLSGKVTCEVTTDDIIPQSASLESTLVVHDLPESGPVLVLERTADAYSPGETLRANCSSPPSKPAPILFFIINGNPCGNEGLCERRVVPVSDTLTWSATFLTLHLKPSHFKKGNLNILCKAVINGIYEDQTSIDVKESPVYQVKIGSLRPSSIPTLQASWSFTLGLFFLSTVMR